MGALKSLGKLALMAPLAWAQLLQIPKRQSAVLSVNGNI